MKKCLIITCLLLISLFGCKSLMKKCEPAPDYYYPSLDSQYVDLLKNMDNKQEVFKTNSSLVDTIIFGSLKYNNVVSRGSTCNEPHQTCCNNIHYESYSIPFSSKISKPILEYDIQISSILPIGGLTSTYIWNFTSIDTLVAVDYNHTIIPDAYIKISKSTNDTLSLISKSKGILIFTDNQGRKWNRVL